MTALVPKMAVVLVISTASASLAAAQEQRALQVVYDSVSAQFIGVNDGRVRLVPVDRDPTLSSAFDHVSVIPLERIRSALTRAGMAFEEAFSCNDRGECDFRGDITGTIAFGIVHESDEVMTIGAVVRYAAGNRSIAPSMVWFRYDVVRRDGRLVAVGGPFKET